MEAWIREGRVSVSGRVAVLGDRARRDQTISVDGRALRLEAAAPAPRLIAYHKPGGELVTRRDPEGRDVVFARLPRLRRGRWIAIGRLDFNTSGLLLFTDSGDVAHRLMHPSHGIEREYAVRVLGALSREACAQLLDGVPLPDGLARLERLTEMTQRPGSAANRWYRVVLLEGRYREVRRLFEAVGVRVSRLIRIRYGSVVLPRSLRAGNWVELDLPQAMAGVPARPAAGHRLSEKPKLD